LSYAIRRVDSSDASGIYAVEKACFRDPYPSKFLDHLIESEQNRFFVAVENTRVVGYAVASAKGSDGHIVSVAVSPEHRRRRIGTALLSATMQRLTSEGVRQIHLEVRKGNTTAISFYERMGYKVSSEIKHYYADGEDAWVLVRWSHQRPAIDNRGPV
jgi:ribosomal-protein-alanine N-acetyltransferase